MSDAEMVTLFVYGTLMRGGVRHRLLAGQRFLGVGRTRAGYALVDLGPYPALVRRDDEIGSVHGELYEVASSRVSRLDEEEGAPELYQRESIDIEGRNGPVVAYIFRQDTDGRPRCPDGRWTHRETPPHDA
jgi:gamma-glutamylcyclotransferase (GGCT)/AIG2-like uncharacterized protein YtfP